MPRHQPFTVGQTRALHAAIAGTALVALVVGMVAHLAVALGVVAGLIALELGGFAWAQRRAGVVTRGLADATALVDRAAYAEAGVQLDRLADGARWIPNLHALIAHRRLDVHVAAGELAAAEALGGAIERSGWLARPGSALYVMYPALCAKRAVIAALQGDGDAATRWRDRARATVSAPRRHLLVYMESILLARAGQHAAAARAVNEVSLDGRVAGVPGSEARVLRWVYAFAVAGGGAAPEVIAPLRAAAAPATSEVRALEAWWPELVAFATSAS
jgi:hypothetical protein